LGLHNQLLREAKIISDSLFVPNSQALEDIVTLLNEIYHSNRISKPDDNRIRLVKVESLANS
jgi:hypothetical protein